MDWREGREEEGEGEGRGRGRGGRRGGERKEYIERVTCALK